MKLIIDGLLTHVPMGAWGSLIQFRALSNQNASNFMADDLSIEAIISLLITHEGEDATNATKVSETERGGVFER